MSNLPRVFVVAALVLSAALPSFDRAIADECTPSRVGTDSIGAQGIVAPFFGASTGETFTAEATSIRSIIVWQAPTADSYLVHPELLITRVIPDGRPDVTDTGILFRTRLTVDEAALRIVYVFEPPLQLPGPGHYAFLIHGECDPPGPQPRLNLTDDLYPGGQYVLSPWTFHICGCCVFQPAFEEARGDLLFQIEFCTDTPTSVRPSTWGGLKATYR